MFVVQIGGDDLGSKRSPLGLAHASHSANFICWGTAYDMRKGAFLFDRDLFGIIKGILIRGRMGLGA
jgi:hypothetical protein